MAKPIITPLIIRGKLYFQVHGVLFSTRTAALCAASAVLEGGQL